MATCRTRSIAVEAAQWIPGEHVEGVCYLTRPPCLPEQHVHTKNGAVVLNEGDWIIPELDGSGHYPCNADHFAATYEPT